MFVRGTSLVYALYPSYSLVSQPVNHEHDYLKNMIIMNTHEHDYRKEKSRGEK